MKTILELRDVKKSYQLDDVKVEALKGINIKINEGEFVAIIGASGSGKSTLLHILGLLDRPTHGSVFIDGKNTKSLNDDELTELRGKNIGFIFQFFNLYPTLTSIKNVELPLAILDSDSREEKAMEMLELVGMKDRKDHMPSQLSGGQRQRVAIARALVTKPEIILADEPTGNLDSETGKEVIDELVRVNKKTGKTVVIITHDQHIASHAKRIIEIKDGEILSDRRK